LFYQSIKLNYKIFLSIFGSALVLGGGGGDESWELNRWWGKTWGGLFLPAPTSPASPNLQISMLRSSMVRKE